MRTRTSEFIEATAFICIVAAMGLVWYHAYVKPADEMRNEIMDCMVEIQDQSERGYKHCFDTLKAQRK